MNTHEADCASLIDDLENRRVSDGSAQKARSLVKAGFSRRVVATTFASLSARKGDREMAVEETMWALEALAEFDAETACILMSELWGEASALMMHHVCNGIDLWLDEHKMTSLLDDYRKKNPLS
jgi:hypothetical protein